MKKILFTIIFGLIILPVSIGMSYASVDSVFDLIQTPPPLPMAVTTDRTSYSDGDKITISGTVRDASNGTAVTIKIRSSNNNLVFIGQATVSDGGMFSTTITSGGNLWQDAGKYEVVVKSGNKDAFTTFQFGGYVPFTTMAVEGSDLSVSYKIVGGKLLKIQPNTQTKSLVLTVKTTNDGTLTISLPRSVIDSNSGGRDIPFTVIINGESVKHVEQSGSSERTLIIPFSKGTTEIIITGTKVIPEFGPISGLVFAIAILSIVLVFKKSGMRITGTRSTPF